MTVENANTCRKGVSFKCMHAREAIEMLLAHAPLRYSIKEIAELTDFHRNTIRPAVRELVNEGKIHSSGSSYFNNSVSEHYRVIVKSLYESIIELEPEERQKALFTLGKKLVRNNLGNILDDDYSKNFDHDNIIEALVHLKMSYPFADLTYFEEGSGSRKKEVLRSNISFEVDDLDVLKEVNEDQYNRLNETRKGPDSESEILLTVDPCLCKGESYWEFACDVVAGALEGGIEKACTSDGQQVIHIKKQRRNEDDTSCMFYINAQLENKLDQLKIADQLGLM